MSKIDRLGWTAGVSFSLYGLRMGIRVNNPGVLPRLLALLPPRWTPTRSPVVERLYSLVVGGATATPGSRHFNLLYADGSRLVRTLTDEPIYDALAGDLELYLAEFARRRLFVHAGVVGWRGRAILIPGRSRAGKSTLVAALLRAGATYYSDEYAVLDARGRVHPFPRPLSLRGAPGEHPSKHTSATFGARTGTASLPVGLVLVTRYVAGARWRPRPRSRARAVLDLFANTPSARRKPEAAFHILHQTLGDARVVSGVRGESEAVIEWVLGECVPAGAR